MRVCSWVYSGPKVMIRIGRFRILFAMSELRHAVRWYIMFIGYESTWLKTWKKEIRSRIDSRRRAANRRTVRECVTIIAIGLAIGISLNYFLHWLMEVIYV